MSTSPEQSLPVPSPATKALALPATGTRTLAAIVFTDTADFSSLMSRDEDRTMRLVARDLNFMRTVCGSYGGEVAKATGDGLLMVFSSAVQAMGCALEIQRDLREQHKAQPAAERLDHRIGIHLGDVFQQDGDVMGDGVNIAARLQAEAEKGGICLSGTVYDIVHNRVPFTVTRTRARKLKNVGTIVTYQAFPPSSGSPYPQMILGWVRRRKRLVTTLAILALVYLLFWPRHISVKEESNTPAREIGPLGPALGSSEDDDDDESNSHTAVPPGSHLASMTDFYVARYEHMEHYDFAGMLDWLKTNYNPDIPREKMSKACSQMKEIDDWCTRQLAAYRAEAPLNVHGDHLETEEANDIPTTMGEQDFQAWGGPNGGIVYKTALGMTTLAKDQVPPLLWVRIAATLLRQNAPPGEPMTQQLRKGLSSFREAYQVSN